MEHPSTHPKRPDLPRSSTEADVLDIALQLRNMLSNEEIWYVLQTWKDKVRKDAKEENEKDDPCDCDGSCGNPWGDIGGEAFSEREDAEFQGCGPNCI